jgi:hypothetical protein
MSNYQEANETIDDILADLEELSMRMNLGGKWIRCTKKELKQLKICRRRIRQAITAYGMDWREWVVGR